MSKMAVFLADGVEEIEALTPVDMCRRAGIEVRTVSIMGTKEIKGSHGITFFADELFEAGAYGDCDLLMLPGGGLGTENLEKHEGLLEEIKKAEAEGKYLAAICAAPRILGKLEMLKGKNATCYPGNERFMKGARYHAELKAVTDGKIITARGMGAALGFGTQIIMALCGGDKAEEILETVKA
jgi:4-methyl-5(b-hydroxyethyl)-thiazole monophosphate biosynthesis